MGLHPLQESSIVLYFFLPWTICGSWTSRLFSERGEEVGLLPEEDGSRGAAGRGAVGGQLLPAEGPAGPRPLPQLLLRPLGAADPVNHGPGSGGVPPPVPGDHWGGSRKGPPLQPNEQCGGGAHIWNCGSKYSNRGVRSVRVISGGYIL